MPSEKRSRQRAAREARLALQAKAKKRRQQTRNAIIIVGVAAVVIVLIFVLTGNNSPKKKQAAPPTTTTLVGTTTTSTTAASGSTTTTAAGTKTNAQLQAAANKAAVAAGCPASTKTQVNTQKYSAAPAMSINTNMLYSATIDTTAGSFDVALNAKSAPITVNNFVFLAQKGYYHCVIFHRVIPNFMDQTGDPTGTGTGLPAGTTSGTGQPGYTITDENPPKATDASQQYPLGSVAMANTGSPNSGGSQFFIVAGPAGEQLPNTYALFGRVITGMNVVDTINGEGSAAGVPPDVTQRILSVTIHEASGP